MPPAVAITAASCSAIDALEAGALVAAEGREPRDLDQVGNARAVVLLDQAVELDEGTAEMLRQPAPSVDLPAPRRPTSAIRRARSAAR